jgi:hypothetical protein
MNDYPLLVTVMPALLISVSAYFATRAIASKEKHFTSIFLRIFGSLFFFYLAIIVGIAGTISK